MVTTSSSRSLEELAQMVQSGNPMAYIPYAEALRARGEFIMALEVCQRGLAQGPPTVAGRVLLARIHFDMGKYETAESECIAALAQAPESISARRLMVQLAIKRRAFVKALNLIEGLRADLGDDPELRSAELETQRGLADRFVSDIALASVILRGRSTLAANRGEILQQIRRRSEVLDAQVVANGDSAEDWGEMLRAWENLCRGAALSPIRLAVLETTRATALVRSLGSSEGNLVVTIRPDTSFGAVKHLADLLAVQSGCIGGSQSE